MTSLKIKILNTVKNNDITMIPRWKFVLYSMLGVLGIIFAFLVMLFFFSLILFLLSRYGFMYIPLFGFMATLHTLNAIPLLLLFCTIGLLILIEVISRYYSFSFRQPLAVTLLLLTTSATIISFFISEAGVHDYVRDYARKNHIGIMERMYERPKPFRSMDTTMDIIRGEVLSSTPTTTTLRLFDGAIVIAYATTTGESKFNLPSVGDDVMIFGKFVGNTFEIVGIRPTPQTPFGKRMHTYDGHMMNKNLSD